MKPFKPSSKIFLLTVPRRYHFCGSFSVNNILFKYKVHRDTTDTSLYTIQNIWKGYRNKSKTCLNLLLDHLCYVYDCGISWSYSHTIFDTLPCVILGQVFYLIVSIPDLCRLSYFKRSPYNGMETIFPHYEISFDYVHFLWRTCVNV